MQISQRARQWWSSKNLGPFLQIQYPAQCITLGVHACHSKACSLATPESELPVNAEYMRHAIDYVATPIRHHTNYP